MTDRERIDHALAIAYKWGGVPGEQHRAWVLDQVVRALTGCPMVSQARAGGGVSMTQGESGEYREWVARRGGWDDGVGP